MVAPRVFNLSTRRQRQGYLLVQGQSIVYKMSFRMAKATHRNPISQTKRPCFKNTKKKKQHLWPPYIFTHANDLIQNTQRSIIQS